MNNGWGSCVQEVETFEDLPAPRTQNLDFHHLETLQVPAGKKLQIKCILCYRVAVILEE